MGYSPVTKGEVLDFPCVFRQDDGTPFPISNSTGIQMVFTPAKGSAPENVRFVARATGHPLSFPDV